MNNARGREVTCQEASALSMTRYIACGRPASVIIDNGDEHPYWMCEPCADHNVRNRGAVDYTPKKKVGSVQQRIESRLSALAAPRNRDDPNPFESAYGGALQIVREEFA